MTIRVEFFGVPRRRTGVAATDLPIDGNRQLGEILRELVDRYPDLAVDCIRGQTLQDTAVVSINGERFVRDETTVVACGECLLLLSADAGG